MLVAVFRFSTEKSFKTSESTCFSKTRKKKYNELNIFFLNNLFFLNEIEEDLLR